MKYSDVIDFWFIELKPANWFAKDESLDARIRERFGALHERASKCELSEWRSEPLGRFAEILVLDQFSRNIFRDHAASFASDPLALGLAQEAIRVGADRSFSAPQKSFLYMPFMHSESRAIHEASIQLFAQPGLEMNLDFAKRHKVIIDRFGRYPHRNRVLGRESTPEEIEFLKQPGSGF